MMLFSLYAKESFNAAVESYMKSYKKIDPLIGQDTLERLGNLSLQRNARSILEMMNATFRRRPMLTSKLRVRKTMPAANHKTRDKKRSKATTFQPQPAPRLSRVN